MTDFLLLFAISFVVITGFGVILNTAKKRSAIKKKKLDEAHCSSGSCCCQSSAPSEITPQQTIGRLS